MEQQKGRQFAAAFKHDTAASPITTGYTHGPGGLLTFPGVDPVVFSTVMGADSIIGQIPTSPTLYMNPVYATITGVLDTTGSNKDGVCDNAPVAGLMKACYTTSIFGRYEMATPELEINRLGQRNDRADPMDLRLVNSPIAAGGPFMTAGDVATPGDLFTNEVARKFWERNVAIHRLLAKQLWVGNPANNSAGGGYKEMTGLQLLVNTGYVDVETGTACPAVDSIVRSFGHVRVNTDANRTVAFFTNVYHQLKERARRAGVAPVRWAMAMRGSLFYELTAIWPCSYLSFRCNESIGANMQGNIDAQDAVRFRDEMRAGSYLLIDGERVEVLTDDGIPEGSNTTDASVPSGCFASDVYFLPMSIVGGQSVLFMEYFQYSNPAIQDALGQMVLGRIEGPWITWPRQTNLCVQWQSKIEPRLVLRTPWLAARIQDVNYCPIEHERQPFPTDPYFVDGGKTTRSGPSYYSLWQT
jgi:hypothetical protein